MAIRKPKEDKVFDIINFIILLILALIVLYPLYFIVIASISDPDAVNGGGVTIYPIQPSLDGYARLFEDSSIWTGYRNTIIYTVMGTLLSIIVTVSAGFALSRKNLAGRNVLMAYFIITMYFSGGMIPLYIVINTLGLNNNPAVMVILGMVSVYNMIICRTFFQSNLPDELFEAAEIDGCGVFQFYFRIAIPLSKAIIAVMVVFYAVGQWNSYFNAMMYLSNKEYYPLQLVLREILLQNRLTDVITSEGQLADSLERQRYAELIKYGVIVVSSVPVLIMYPFAQKYFVKGVMIGSVKG